MTDIVIDDFAETGSHIKSEDPSGSYSRDEITLAPTQGTLKAGTVLGQITAAGATKDMYAVYNNSATNGVQAATVVLWATTETHATAGTKTVVHARHAELWMARLRFAAGTSDADKLAAYADLAGRGMVCR